MKQLDTVLLSIVVVVWAVFALMYATIPMIQMPSSFRVWGLGAVVFLVLTVLSVMAANRNKGKGDEGSD